MTVLKAEIKRLWRALILKQNGKVAGFVKPGQTEKPTEGEKREKVHQTNQ